MLEFFKPKKAKTDRLTIDGAEKLDPKPMAIPVGFDRPERLEDQIARLVRTEKWKMAMEEAGNETYEEANDFDMPEDDIEFSKHELVYDPVKDEDVPFDEFMSRQDGYRKAAQAVAERGKKKSATSPAKKPEDASSAPQNAGDDASDSGE